MKKLLLFGALALSSISFSQEVVSTQGDSYTNGSGSIDFTIGEVVINTGTDGTNDLTQGFHQTTWNFLGVDNHEQNFEATVYPNPLGSELFIQTENFEFVTYVLYDAAGRIVAENKLNALQTGIDVSILAPSTYSLVLRNENQENIKTFKLVKTH
ncbi:MAG: T9SS type A sorting domain-containing protein [Crocinitomicaceae bacterium]